MPLTATPAPWPEVGEIESNQSSVTAVVSSRKVLISARSAMPAMAVLSRDTIEKVPPTEVPEAPAAGAAPPAWCKVCTWLAALTTVDPLKLRVKLISSTSGPLGASRVVLTKSPNTPRSLSRV